MEMKSREDLIAHILSLESDFRERGDEWENQTIGDFLEAMSRWLSSSQSYYNNTGQDIDATEPSWQLFADALSAAVVYE